MESFINRIKFQLKSRDILTQIILLNIIVFIVINIIKVVCTLFKIEVIDFSNYLGIHSDLSTTEHKIWTVFTYMFIHVDFFHILFNMLFLYWFGKMFLNYFNGKQLGSLYILGGITGAILYLIMFNVIPYYISMGDSVMIGSSASVMAIVFATAIYQPRIKVSLLFIGEIKIIYIAIVIFIIDIISIDSQTNAGGHIAHIGGALIGLLFAKQILKGRDITNWITSVINFIVNLFKKRYRKNKKIKFKTRTTETDYQYNERKRKNEANIDQILDKIKASGYSSLSIDEKKQLFDASKK